MKQSTSRPLSFGALPRGASRLHVTRSLLTLSLTILLILGLSSPAAHAQTYTEKTLHSFTGTSDNDGSFPENNLTVVNGLLYGTTAQGGPDNEGTLFSIDPSTQTTTLVYSFRLGSDGFFPLSNLLDVGGVLYGTTNGGGSISDGTVFSVNPDGSNEQILHSFTSTNSTATVDGQFPRGKIIDVNGILYGTTETGGADSQGTVVSIDLSTHAEHVLHSFTGTNGDGSAPEDGLIAVNGILYGTTQSGGTNDQGTVYSIDPSSHAETVLYSFGSSSTDGADPLAGLIAVNGTLYGTTNRGGVHGNGTVFSIDPSTHAETVLYSFGPNGSHDGANPQASLILVNGVLYGTTALGGSGPNGGTGTVFSIDPSTQSETVVYSFGTNGANDGELPQASLLDVNGTLYGTTSDGGTGGEGTVFSLTPTGTGSTPAAANDRYTPKYATAFAVKAPGVLANDNNGGEGPLTATLVSQPTHGTLTFHPDGSFTYTPGSGFVGTDTFTYQDSNPIGKSNIATVTLTVQATRPTAHNDSYALKYNTAFTINAPGVLANDDNGDNAALTAALIGKPTHGSLTFNSDGSFLYKPSTGYVGTDTFTYQDSNPIGTSSTATVTLTVQAIAPAAAGDAYTVKYSTAFTVKAPGVLANDSSGGSSPLTAMLDTKPTHGSLTFHADGSFTYSPDAGFIGTDRFTYHAINPIGKSNTATVSLTVRAAVPTAANDAYTVKHNTPFVVKAPGVLANDYAGDMGTLTATLVSKPTHGSLTFQANGSFTYTPSSGYSGTDTFTYQDSNPIGRSNTATVTLGVQ